MSEAGCDVCGVRLAWWEVYLILGEQHLGTRDVKACEACWSSAVEVGARTEAR